MRTHGRLRPILTTEQAGGLAMAVAAVFWLLSFVWPPIAMWVALIVGIMLLAAFLVSGQYGYLVAGGIVTGVGAGVVLASSLEEMTAGAVVLFSIAVGFVGIWAVSRLAELPEHHVWPLIPAAILALTGLALLAGTPEALQYLGVVLAAALLGAGLLIVYRGRPGGGHRTL
jgi:hypothetical protein